ncbi:hypothetical protein P3S67_006927 [Capsicum chacoense]
MMQSVTQIQDNNQQEIYEPMEIAEVFVRYYTNLLGTDLGVRKEVHPTIFSQGPRLSMEQQYDLLRSFSRQDIKNMAFSFDINKSLGPDGYGGGFFKNSWNIIGEDICTAVLEFFQTDKPLKQINATTIFLIPKVDNPRVSSLYRPISCCNIVYK